MKITFMNIIITLSLLLPSAYAIEEYTRIEGKVLGIDTKNSSIEVKVRSKTCKGVHTFDIENSEAINGIKVGDNVSLYIIGDCNKAKVGEQR